MNRTFDSPSAVTTQGSNLISFIARPFLTGHDLSSLQAVVKMEGDNKMVTSFKGMTSVTELNGDTITNVSWHSGLAIPVFEGHGEVKGGGQVSDISHSPIFSSPRP